MVFLKWRASAIGGTQVCDHHQSNAWLASRSIKNHVKLERVRIAIVSRGIVLWDNGHDAGGRRRGRHDDRAEPARRWRAPRLNQSAAAAIAINSQL